MDRNIVYPGSIPLDTDLLTLNRNVMTALGHLAHAVFGSNPVVNGLIGAPTTPASMQMTVSPGSVTQLTVLDTLAYGSLAADTVTPLLKMGLVTSTTTYTLSAPTVAGQTNTYLIEATFQEVDNTPVVLPYYNASNPSQPYSGPANNGTPQNTVRAQQVSLQLKLATSSGAATPPPVDSGWIGLYTITVPYGKTSIVSADIVVVPTAPFISYRLPSLRPGFGSGVKTFTASATWVVPAGVSQVEVEVWGGGSGTYASTSTWASGGGSGGGYARKLVTGLTPGQSIAVTVGVGGAMGTTAGAVPTAGGTSSFGTYVSATGGSLNSLVASTGDVRNGAWPPGNGSNGDVNLYGSAGLAGVGNQGGMGGASAIGGSQNSGTTGNTGWFPGGGASGAGTGANSATPYNGAAGASGFVVVRW